MNRSAAEILEDARQLPPRRGGLAGGVSPDEGDEPEIEAAWDGEIKRRIEEIDSGAVEMVPGELVRAEMVAALSSQAQERLYVLKS